MFRDASKLVFSFSPLFDFADYNFPKWKGWLGAVIFTAAIWLLWRSHADLGRSWTPTLGIREDHHLVTGGVLITSATRCAPPTCCGASPHR